LSVPITTDPLGNYYRGPLLSEDCRP